MPKFGSISTVLVVSAELFWILTTAYKLHDAYEVGKLIIEENMKFETKIPIFPWFISFFRFISMATIDIFIQCGGKIVSQYKI